MSVSTIFSTLKAVSKVIVVAVGMVAGALVNYTNLIPTQFQGYATAFIALATLIGAYHAPYAPLGAKARAQAQQGGNATPPAHQAD